MSILQRFVGALICVAGFAEDARSQSTELVSLTTGDAQSSTFELYEPTVSRTGRFVLFLGDDDLIAPDSNCPAWWLRDRELGLSERITRRPNGGTVDCPQVPLAIPFQSVGADVSEDGRFVVYDYVSADLDAAARPVGRRVYLLDRQLNLTRRIGPGPSIPAAGPRMDHAGRRVSMVAFAPGTFNQLQIHDLQTGDLTSVLGAYPTTLTENVISGDGQSVAFRGLRTGQPDNGIQQIFHFNLATRELTLVSATPAGVPANQPARDPTINFDGSVVAYVTFATNLVAHPGRAIIATSIASRAHELVSVHSVGQPLTGFFLDNPSISDSGSRVAFRSNSLNAPGAGDAFDGFPQVYVFDRLSRRLVLASRNAAGVGASLGSSVQPCEQQGSIVVCGERLEISPNISGNGRFVAFHSFGTNLIPNDANGPRPDIYLHDLGSEASGAPSAAVPVPVIDGGKIALLTFLVSAFGLAHFSRRPRS